MQNWIPTKDKVPEKGQNVDWISPGGEQVNGGRFEGGLIWFLPGGDMYVYYTPTYWRPAQKPEV